MFGINLKNKSKINEKIFDWKSIEDIKKIVWDLSSNKEYIKQKDNWFIQEKWWLDAMIIPKWDIEVFNKNFKWDGNKFTIFKNERWTYWLFIWKDVVYNTNDLPLDKTNFSDFRMYWYYKFWEDNIKDITNMYEKIDNVKDFENFMFYYLYLW